MQECNLLDEWLAMEDVFTPIGLGAIADRCKEAELQEVGLPDYRRWVCQTVCLSQPVCQPGLGD
jgi:hypothetical protein